MFGRKKKKTMIELREYVSHGNRSHYKTITVDVAPVTAWRAIKSGFLAIGMDLEKLRAERKRKGGK